MTRVQAVELRSVGGTFGGARKPCEFLCLTLKLLQIQPEKDIIIEYILNDEFKYVRLLGAPPSATPCTAAAATAAALQKTLVCLLTQT